MKIINFATNNFRAITGGLDDNRINFNESNTIFIFGQNNVGKSTFLAAYDFMFKDTTPTVDDFHKKGESGSIEFELELGVDESDLEYIAEKQEKKVNSFKSYLSDELTIKIKREFGITYKDKGKPTISNAKDMTFNPSTNKWDNSAFGSIGLSQVFQALMPTPILIKAMPSEKEVEDVVNEILAAKAKSRLNDTELVEFKDAQEKVRTLQEKMYNPVAIEEYKIEVNNHFTQLFPDTKIEIGESDKVKWTEDKFGKKFSVGFQKQNKDGSPDELTPNSYNSIGHGAVRSAIFSLLLMRDIAEELQKQADRKEYLILFEEPELFLYPRILRELRALIYKVSDEDYPYQILCASHSPQMIDLSKRKSTLIRMVKEDTSTKLYQVKDEDLKEAKEAVSVDALKQAMYEVLRFNPYICESFYADEVILIEGPTEEIIIRGIIQKLNPAKDLFIVNCGSVTNIPFYQRIYRKFAIKCHVICDTDTSEIRGIDNFENPIFTDNIQGTIYTEHLASCNSLPRSGGLFRVHQTTFEPAHKQEVIPLRLRYPEYPVSNGKPLNANKYWTEILEANFENNLINAVPIIKYTKEITEFNWQ